MFVRFFTMGLDYLSFSSYFLVDLLAILPADPILVKLLGAGHVGSVRPETWL